MALPVGSLVEAERLDAVGPVGHDRLGAPIIEPLPQFGTVIGGIAKQPGGWLGAPDEALSRRAIVGLAAGQQDGKKTAFSICQCVDLRIAPAS
jgi:hypothetical protein